MFSAFIVGLHNLAEMTWRDIYFVDEITKHNYNRKTGWHDIALMRLVIDIEDSPKVGIIKLPPPMMQGPIQTGQTLDTVCILTGHIHSCHYSCPFIIPYRRRALSGGTSFPRK